MIENSTTPALQQRSDHRSEKRKLFFRILFAGLSFLVLFVLALGIWLHSRLTGSLPVLSGNLRLDGLHAPVSIERDRLGIPTITGDSREDIALATGFVHAQDRFFQMDLLRRRAAGELAGLFGGSAVDWDRSIRPHRLRSTAQRAVDRLSTDERSILESYTAGVNAGLASLGTSPVEYLVLRSQPEIWKPEDTLLVLLTMFVELQDEQAKYESTLDLMHRHLPEELFIFLTPMGSGWDTPMIGEAYATPAIPGPEWIDLRSLEQAAAPQARSANYVQATELRLNAASNSFALAGRLTRDGRALLANDMHLELNVPNLWYRTSFVRTGESQEPKHRVTGITLPGLPFTVIGSNGRIAWGLTNAQADVLDLVEIELDPDDPERYLTPDGPQPFYRSTESIRVRGEADESLDVVSTIWGPLLDQEGLASPRAVSWTAHHPEVVDLGLLRLENARNLDEALAAANASGVPVLNLVAADAAGHIGWTVAGKLPCRSGFDGRLPTSWADGTRGWQDWLAPEEYPRIVDPESGRVWNANNRTVDAPMLGKLGDGDYALGARARQIRDGLFALQQASAMDLLKIQLDDRAVFLERWHRLLLATLTPAALDDDPRRREFLDLVKSWEGRAAVDSAGYWLVRAFRTVVRQEVFEPLLAPLKSADPKFDYDIQQREGPLWKLVTQRPRHLLNAKYESWDELFLASVDRILDFARDHDIALSEATWGKSNTVEITHVLSDALPWFRRWLDMPAQPLAGDRHMPRVQRPDFGATERMVVAPGDEEHGIFHMVGGQSGHPLSPHYRDAHRAWVEAEPTPFLPGPPIHTLELVPSRSQPRP